MRFSERSFAWVGVGCLGDIYEYVDFLYILHINI